MNKRQQTVGAVHTHTHTHTQYLLIVKKNSLKILNYIINLNSIIYIININNIFKIFAKNFSVIYGGENIYLQSYI